MRFFKIYGVGTQMFTEAASKAIVIAHIDNRWRCLSIVTLRLYSLHSLDGKVSEPRIGFDIRTIFRFVTTVY
jgi:hypothetical protein